ncbi:MAG: NAD(P)-dependent oxidoreductase [Saprospiraceae bacterium]|nr:NAD(P)-dependent oxidoreductase [Saprospiraceae bacterium]NNK89521.1 NAD(P)-dependent oxidoreductase [Saprospiraceae bacterium]
MSKKILITGSNGFVGSYLVEESIRQGYNVFAGIRKSSNKQYLLDPRINFFYYDFENEDNLREKLRSHHFDFIVLNAGITRAPDKETYFKVNAGYTRKFCKILIEENVIPEKLVFISSLAAYGPADYQKEQILTSDSVPHPNTWYGESKLQAEQFLESFNSIPSLIFRPTAVYGPRDVDFVTVYKTIKSGIEPKIGLGKQELSFIYVKDLANLIINALSSQHSNKGYFVSDGTVYSSYEYNLLLKSVLSRKNTLKLTIPISFLRLAAFLNEGIGYINGEYPVLNRNKVNELKARSFAIDVKDLKNDFNFAPVYDLRKGLDETIEWCKLNKLL